MSPPPPTSPAPDGPPGAPRVPHHDRMFKVACGTPEGVLAVLRLAGVPEAFVAAIDPGSLRLDTPDTVSDELGELRRDLVFSCTLRDPGSAGSRSVHESRPPEGLARRALLCLIVEHERDADADMPRRSCGYVLDKLLAWRREHPLPALLPVVLPVVVHQGARPWRGPLALRDQLDADPGTLDLLAPHLVGFRLTLLDLGARSPAQVASLPAPPMVRVAFGVMRTVVVPGLTPEQVLDAFRFELAAGIRALVAEPGGRARFAVVVRYTLFRVQGLDRFALREVVAVSAGLPAAEVVMSTAEQLIAEGIEKGSRVARGLLRRQLERAFGPLSPAHAARIAAGTLEELEAWGARAEASARIEDVFLRPGPDAAGDTSV